MGAYGSPAAVHLPASLAATCGPVTNSFPANCDELRFPGHAIPHKLLHVSPLALGRNDKDNNWSDIEGYMLKTAEQHHPEFLNDRIQQKQALPTFPPPITWNFFPGL